MGLMKRLLLAPLLLGLITPANAVETCNFVSEYYPDVTIEIDNDKRKFGGFGVIKHKDKPMLDFATGLSNGYGGQYYVIRKLTKDIAYVLYVEYIFFNHPLGFLSPMSFRRGKTLK